MFLVATNIVANINNDCTQYHYQYQYEVWYGICICIDIGISMNHLPGFVMTVLVEH